MPISSYLPVDRGNEAVHLKNAKARYWSLQLLRFGLVGGSATITLALTYSYFISAGQMEPFLANLAAYAIAFAVSFIGHRYWTFGDAEKGGRNDSAVLRFLAVSLTGLAVNSVAVLLLVNWLGFPDWSPLFVFVGFTPVLTFLLNRFWVFYEMRSVTQP